MATDFSPDHTVCQVCRRTAGSHPLRTGAQWRFGVSSYAKGLKTSGWYSTDCEKACEKQQSLSEEQRIVVDREVVSPDQVSAVWERWRTPDYWEPLMHLVKNDATVRLGLCTSKIMDAQKKRTQHWLGQQTLTLSWPWEPRRAPFKRDLHYDQVLSSLCDVCFTLSLRLQELMEFESLAQFQQHYAQDLESRKQRRNHETQTLISAYNTALAHQLEQVVKKLWAETPSFKRCEARLIKRALSDGWDHDAPLLSHDEKAASVLHTGQRYMEWCVVVRCRPSYSELSQELSSLSSLSRLQNVNAPGGLVDRRQTSASLLLQKLRQALSPQAPAMKRLLHSTRGQRIFLTVDLLNKRNNHGLSHTLLQNHTVVCGKVEEGTDGRLYACLNRLTPANHNATRLYVLQDTWDHRVELLRKSTAHDWSQQQVVDLCPALRP